MKNYDRYKLMREILELCQTDKWDQSVNLHHGGKYDFLGFAAKKSNKMSFDGARQYLDLSLFEASLFWNYFDKLTLRELDGLINLICFGQTFDRDGLKLYQADLIKNR